MNLGRKFYWNAFLFTRTRVRWQWVLLCNVLQKIKKLKKFHLPEHYSDLTFAKNTSSTIVKHEKAVVYFVLQMDSRKFPFEAVGYWKSIY